VVDGVLDVIAAVPPPQLCGAIAVYYHVHGDWPPTGADLGIYGWPTREGQWLTVTRESDGSATFEYGSPMWRPRAAFNMRPPKADTDGEPISQPTPF
jgi:hypothetical protein